MTKTSVRRAAALLVTLSAAVLTGVGTTVPASAGTLCNWSAGIGCGNVTNSSTGTYTAIATCNYATKSQLLIPVGSNGQAQGCKDVDGYYVPGYRIVEERWLVPSGCSYNCTVQWVRMSEGWHKINDLQSVTIRVR